MTPAAKPGDAWTAPEHAHSAADLRAVLDSGASAGRLPPGRLSAEVLYNRVGPTRIAWWVLTLSLLLSIAAMASDRRALDLAAGAVLFAGFAVMSWGIGMRWQVAGRIPASNMYESMLFLGWGVGFFAVVATVLMRNRLVVLNAAAGAALTMALTDLLPIDRFIHPMPPVLSGTYWLAIHVPIIMVGYAVLALGMVVAHMQIGVEAFAPARRTLALKMAELQYFYIHVGSILLVAGILTGSMWAASSWGRYWGWDPKEVWSLVAFLAYMAILHARAERLIGTFGVAAWSIVAFQTILMTYLGVNFVLAAGLHSYGFGDSSVVRAMVITALVGGDLHRGRLGQAPEAGQEPRQRRPPQRTLVGAAGRSAGLGVPRTPLEALRLLAPALWASRVVSSLAYRRSRFMRSLRSARDAFSGGRTARTLGLRGARKACRRLARCRGLQARGSSPGPG